MNRLPKIFAKQRFGLNPSPTLVTKFRDENHLNELFGQLPEDYEFPVDVLLHYHQWIEFRNWAVLIDFVSGDGETSRFFQAGDISPSEQFMEVITWMKEGCVDHYKCFRGGDFQTHPDLALGRALVTPLQMQRARDHEVKAILMACKVQCYVAELSSDLSVLTGARNMPLPKFHARQGDTIRYARITDLKSAAGQRGYTPPEDPSGIRKRDHAVRGHWVHRNGTRFWRRAHRRGDKELGTVTRVLT